MKYRQLIASILVSLSVVLASHASPISSASFEKALQDAEMIASLEPSWKVFRTIGDSMGPYFGDHSLIVIQETNFEKVREGMVVVYRTKEGELVSHKVISIEKGALRTKGDANLKADPIAVTAEMLVGTVFCVFHSQEAPEGIAFSSNGMPLPTAICKRF